MALTKRTPLVPAIATVGAGAILSAVCLAGPAPRAGLAAAPRPARAQGASAPQSSQEASKPQEQIVFLSEQITYTPPYAIGDIAIADPAIADYRVLNGRREVLLIGKAEGRTALKIWDQKHARVTDLLIRVTTREAA